MMAVNRLVCAPTWRSIKSFNCCFLSSDIIVLTFLASLQFSIDPILPQLLSFYLICFYVTGFVVCRSFSCHCAVCVYFPSECTVSPNSSRSAPLEFCLCSCEGFSTSFVFAGKYIREERSSCVTFFSEPCEACLFLHLLQQYPSRTACTISHTPCTDLAEKTSNCFNVDSDRSCAL